MATWRRLGAVVVALAAARPALAETYELKESFRPGDCARVQLDMTLTGTMKVLRDGKTAELPLTASASHQYTERVLGADKEGTPSKAARRYAAAVSTIRVEGKPSERELRPQFRLLVAQRAEGRLTAYCPVGPLTSEELALINEHFDSSAVPGLLPGGAVEKKATWKLSNAVVQALCQFEGLVSHDLTGTLEDVTEGAAVFRIAGSASGIELGALAKVSVAASGRYDLLTKRVTSLEWKQKDARDQGPASPSVTAETTITLKRAIVETPKDLGDVALEGVPAGDELPEAQTALWHHDAKGRYNLKYARAWHVVGLNDEQLVLRLLDRGDFVAQATVTVLKKGEPGKHLAGDEFKKLVTTMPGFEAQEVVQEGEEKSANGLWLYRVTVRGQVEGIEVLQSCYLLAGAKGEQAVVTFTMRPSQAGKIGTRDLSLVNGLSFGG
jgi:hypothetical protein